MKWLISILLICFAFSSFSQRDLTPNSKKSAFGKRDFRNLANYGFQFQLGATYLLTKLKNQEHEWRDVNDILRGTYIHDPHGRLGAYAEVGMFHFPKKRSKLSLWMKTVLVSYYDWGIGFKYFRGGERYAYSPAGGGADIASSGEFAVGHLFARFSLHKNIHFKKNKGRDKTNFFLDNSLGINVDYRLTAQTTAYLPPFTGHSQEFSAPLFAQLHYGLGFGFRLKRGSYLIPGVRIPLVGFQQTNPVIANAPSGRGVFEKPSMYWFSSRYWPILFHVKYMFLLQKKNKKGCPPAEINDQDRNTQQSR